MARIRKCTVNLSFARVVYIICYDGNEIVFWNPVIEKWVDGQTSKRKNTGKYHKMYAEGKISSPLEFMIDTGFRVPDELKMKTD